jgi:hypothetical protein
MKKAVKEKHLLLKVRKCIESGDYLYTEHARIRMTQRDVSRNDVTEVLLNGYHEKSKDAFDFHYRCWKYALRGKVDEIKDIRVIVSFDDFGLLIITVIDIE